MMSMLMNIFMAWKAFPELYYYKDSKTEIWNWEFFIQQEGLQIRD